MGYHMRKPLRLIPEKISPRIARFGGELEVGAQMLDCIVSNRLL